MRRKDKELKAEKIIYISGPITGVENYKEAFNKAEQELTAAGFLVLSPTCLPKGLSNGKYMRIDLAMIDCADAVLFLPDWDRSKGALVEFAYCSYTDKPCFYGTATLKEALA
ncbi:MAG: DUF4406 domain-containing protein [Bacteroidales bacterium]|nr:DUF4406 domain-containing protein [Bacteroidales bacterium]